MLRENTVSDMDDPRVVEKILRYEYRIRGNDPERVNENLVRWYMRQKPVPHVHKWESKTSTAVYKFITTGSSTSKIWGGILFGCIFSLGTMFYMNRGWKPTQTASPEWIGAREEYEKNAMRSYIEKALNTFSGANKKEE